ncbi:MAG: ankyrin repeat domain-containing protein [Alphaproteobacteria bacterium]|nr:ankyrin repeat domain-containing protein [Alphaproteobacteria bacterium]
MKKAVVFASLAIITSSVFGMYNNPCDPSVSSDPRKRSVRSNDFENSSSKKIRKNVKQENTTTNIENLNLSLSNAFLSYIKSKSQATDLMVWAAKSNQQGVIDYLIGNNVDVNGTINGQNSLYQAIFNKNLELADHLILNGAKFNAKDKENLLFNAIDTNNLENVKYLIGKGVNIGYTKLVGGFGCKGKKPFSGLVGEFGCKNKESFLDRAVSKKYFDIAKYLIENGAEVHNLQKHQVLSFVIENDSLDLVKHFISKGVDVNLIDGYKRTLLHNAVIYNKFDIVEYLVNNEGININAQDSSLYTPLLYAAEKKHTDIAELLIKKLVEKDDTGSLLNTMGNITNVQSGSSFRPIQNNSQDAKTPLYEASQNGFLDIVKLLAENKADLNMRTNNGVSPTEIAIQNNHVDIVKYLIEHGVNVNETDNNGMSLLSHAIVTNSENSVDLVKYLIEKGAKINKQSNDGWTPLHEAVQAGNKEIVQILLDHDAFVNAADLTEWTPLHEASKKGNLEIFKLLVENGANVYARSFIHFPNKLKPDTPTSIAPSSIVNYLKNQHSRFTSGRLTAHNK